MIDQKELKNRTVGDLVAGDYRMAEVFKSFGIDFCCGGKKTVADVCSQKGIALAELVDKLAALDERPATEHMEFQEWSLSFLIDYIVKIHHSYVQKKAPLLVEYSTKVARVHGQAYPETVEIARKVEDLVEELLVHLRKEEFILFPYIKNLENSIVGKETFQAPPFQTARNPISMMEDEHESAGETMAEIRRLSSDYTPPEGACNTYRVFYSLLEEFENDLHKHVHLENNILFPQALALEEELVG